ncbi:MAG: GNAT family N-acetyltransferase [Proteobacteria bacterium]|nr:GNAT family N-acetyltransferase [Pseudomonadota bacterium]MBI3499533.1 GNAT family N-acetyltransferase [Pseudomonadota bacterium]
MAEQTQHPASAPAAAHVRRATVTDAATLIRLLGQLIAETDFLGPQPGEQVLSADRLAEHIGTRASGEHGIIVIASAGGQLVGYIEAHAGQFRAIRHSCNILGVGVLRTFQGRGIATSMFKMLREWGSEHAKHRFMLTVRADNVSALALYERQGFKREGVLHRQVFVGGQYRDEYMMALWVD